MGNSDFRITFTNKPPQNYALRINESDINIGRDNYCTTYEIFKEFDFAILDVIKFSETLLNDSFAKSAICDEFMKLLYILNRKIVNINNNLSVTIIL